MDKSFESRFSCLVKGKRCIVVAPSGFLKGKGEKSRRFIESFDLVVKNTNMCEIKDDDGELGNRCDVWYGWPATEEWELSIESLQQQNIQYIRLHAGADNYKNALEKHLPDFMHKVSRHSIPFSIVSRESYGELVTELDCIPFTGVLAIYDLLANGASQVFAYGHDFYRTGYFSGRTTYQPVDVQWHKQEPQMKYLYGLLQNEGRFDCDFNLKTILYKHFGDSQKFLESSALLLESELSRFTFAGNQLIIRTCNINIFNSMLSKLILSCKKDLLTLVCQEGVVEQIKLVDNIYIYKGAGVYSCDELEAQFNLADGNYNRCIIPYNGRPLIEYYEVFKWVNSLKIKEVLLMSERGVIKLIDNLDEYLKEIIWYVENRRRALEAISEFDRHNRL